MEIKLPITVRFILDKLQSNGYEAYIVGGCVRDSLIGFAPHDWDICTSALPEQICDVFSDYKIIPTGIQHGTVTVLIEDSGISHFYEITTYRVDGEYKDNRHPESVEFVSSLEQDLSRRDFTINAMAYNPKTGLIDLFDGAKDIENRIIRCVGNPKERFSEDALRILRALRFALRFNYKIDNDTLSAMDQCSELLKNISIERVNSELTIILIREIKPHSQKVIDFIYEDKRLQFGKLFDYLQMIIPFELDIDNDKLFERLWNQDTDDDLVVNMAIVFDNPEIRDILKYLKYSNEYVDTISQTWKLGHQIFDDMDCWIIDATKIQKDDSWNNNISKYYCRLLLSQADKSDICSIIEFASSLVSPDNELRTEWLPRLDVAVEICLKRNEVYRLKDLAINGNDLKGLGFQGREIGIILNGLLDLVMQDRVNNNHDDLIIAIPQVIIDE